MRKTLIAALLLILHNVISSQTNDQEAQVTYQLAQEEYEKNNFSRAIELLDNVENLNQQSKIKTSYLKAKCFEKIATSDESYLKCINTIQYYLANGKDEEKKTELIKLKINIENSLNYIISKQRSGLKYFKLKGKVKSIEIFEDLGNSSNRKEYVFFDSQGNITLDSVRYSMQGQNNVSPETTTMIKKYELNDKRLIIRYSENTEKYPIFPVDLLYDESNRLIRSGSKNNNQNFSNYTYFSNSNLCQEETFFTQGNFQQSNKYEYNENGDELKSKVFYNENLTISVNYEYKYDNSKNWIEQTVTNSYDNSKKTIIRYITYY